MASALPEAGRRDRPGRTDGGGGALHQTGRHLTGEGAAGDLGDTADGADDARRLQRHQDDLLVVGRRDSLQRLDVFLGDERSEEHTSELQSLMRISYAVFCLKKKKNKTDKHTTTT